MGARVAEFMPSRVRTAADVYALISARQWSADALRMIHLDGVGKVLGISEAPVRHMLREAVALGSVGVIVAHLCGRATPEPSDDQIAACAELVQAARTLGIRLLDYLLFGIEGFQSFRVLGLL